MTNQLALSLIKQFEGCKLTAYQDIVGVWTIGYGHTGPDVHAGLIWSQAEADSHLATDLGRFQIALDATTTHDLTEGQEAAVLSLMFNIGIPRFEASTLRRCLNEARWYDAVREFIRWDHAGAREVRGLLIRRLKEALLFIEHSP